MQNKFEIGQIVNTFGIKGEVKVKPYTDNVEQFKKMKSIYISGKETEIENVKFQKNVVILKLKGVDDMTSAEQLRGSILEVERSNKKLPKDTYYIIDLIGLEVYTDNGQLLGTIKDIYNTGANDIYTVKTEDNKEILLPAISEVVKDIDLENKKIIVHILKGLI